MCFKLRLLRSEWRHQVLAPLNPFSSMDRGDNKGVLSPLWAVWVQGQAPPGAQVLSHWEDTVKSHFTNLQCYPDLFSHSRLMPQTLLLGFAYCFLSFTFIYLELWKRTLVLNLYADSMVLLEWQQVKLKKIIYTLILTSKNSTIKPSWER